MKAAFLVFAFLAVAWAASESSSSCSESEGDNYFWDGNEQLKQAYDVALTQLKLDGSLATLWAKYPTLNPEFWPADCLPMGGEEYYTWPRVNEIRGTFRAILETGIWRAVSVKGLKTHLIDSTSLPSVGAYAELFTWIVERISDHYRRPIQIRETQIDASDFNMNVFRLLWANHADSTFPNFHPGGIFLDSRRSTVFLASCWNRGELLPVHTRRFSGEGASGSNLVSWTALNNAVAAASAPKIGVAGEGAEQVAHRLWPTAQIIMYRDGTDGFRALQTSVIIAMVGANPTNGESTNKLLNLDTATSGVPHTGHVTFFRRDHQQCDSEWDWDVPSEWNDSDSDDETYLSIMYPSIYANVQRDRAFREEQEIEAAAKIVATRKIARQRDQGVKHYHS